MNNLLLTIFSITISCSIFIILVSLLDKVLPNQYSRKWKYVVWSVIAIRLILPINIPFYEISIPSSFVHSIEQVDQKGAESFDYMTKDQNNEKSAKDTTLINNNQSNKKSVIDNKISESRTQVNDTHVLADEKKVAKTDLASWHSSLSLLDFATIIWSIGVVIYLAYHLFAYIYFKHRLNRYSYPVNDELMELFLSVCSDLGIKHKINIVKCSLITSPILIGFRTSNIVLPDMDLTKEQYLFILKHELIHFKNRDLYYKILLLLANSLHWFNPFVHYMTYMANLDMELYCDERLIANNNIKYRENYSLTLLKIMASSSKDNILLSTSFTGKKKKLKNRFYLIMNGRKLKKGTILIASFICLILVVGNIVACSVPSNSSKAENMVAEEKQIITVASDNTPSKNQLDAISHVLVVGISVRDNVHTDSILVASINPNTKEIILTSFLRDMYVSIPGNGKNKLNKAFEYGGVKLVKETIESNFQITIDQYLAVDMQAFEEIVNSIGGVELELTEQEANYLNSTNFISDKVYRNVIVGKQRLNGSQALGYARVRNIPTAQGEKGDLGRTVRLRSMLMSIMAEYIDKDIIELTKITVKILPYITTDLNYDEIQTYLSTYLQEGRKFKSVSIPVEGSYEQTRVDGMSVIVPELETNQEYLKETFN